MTYISFQSLTSPLRLSVLQAQAALTQDQTEIASGAPADLGITLGAQTGADLSLKSSIDQLNAYTGTNAVATTRLSATSNALDTMIASAQNISADLTNASSTGGTTTGLTGSATAALQSLIAGLNTSAAGESVFGGINSGVTPIADYFSTQTSSAKQAVDNAFQQTFGTSQTSTAAGSISGTAMQSFLNTQFSALFSNSGWQADWSSASSQTINSAISPSENIATSVSANQGAFQKIAQAYTMLTEFTGANLGTDAKAAVVSTAAKLMSSGLAALTDVQAGVGLAQASVTSANSQISAQVNVLTTNVNSLESVDTYALSNQVTTLQTQLEASYELTSRLQSLSLVNYLTAG